jgi:hypothetical protein
MWRSSLRPRQRGFAFHREPDITDAAVNPGIAGSWASHIFVKNIDPFPDDFFSELTAQLKNGDFGLE